MNIEGGIVVTLIGLVVMFAAAARELMWPS